MLARFLSSRFLDHSGQSIVEIGLVTPFLLIALYVPVDFGIAYYTAHLTQNVVREVARVGVSTDPLNAATAAVIANNALYGSNRIPLRLNAVTVTVTLFGGVNCMQNVSVTAQGSYSYFFYQFLRLIGVAVPNTGLIRRSSRMRYDFQPFTYSNPCSTPSFPPVQATRA